jgi:hypothetical protein
MRWGSFKVICGVALLLGVGSLAQADQYGLTPGKLELQSANVLAFGPDGILFIGDAKAAKIYAVQTGDKPGDPSKVKQELNDASGAIAKQLGVAKAEIADLAVNPLSGHLFVSVTTDAGPRIVVLDGQGKVAALPIDQIAFAKLDIPNPAEDKVVGEGRRARNHRMNSVTDLAFVEGKLLVSGISSGDTPSTVRSFDFPFNDKVASTGLEIYHGAHGQLENYAPIRTFVPFIINGEPNVLAGFVCTPLVKFPVSSIAAAPQTKGTTVAELGNRNQPLDMIAYKKDGQDFLLLANSARGVMKISTEDLDKAAAINAPVGGGGTAGQKFETVADWQGVVQLERLNDGYAVVLVTNEGRSDLKTLALP